MVPGANESTVMAEGQRQPKQKSHTILGGKVHIYKRGSRGLYYCATSVERKQYKKATGTDDLHLAKDIADQWYMKLRGMVTSGDLEKVTAKRKEKTFLAAAE